MPLLLASVGVFAWLVLTRFPSSTKASLRPRLRRVRRARGGGRDGPPSACRPRMGGTAARRARWDRHRRGSGRRGAPVLRPRRGDGPGAHRRRRGVRGSADRLPAGRRADRRGPAPRRPFAVRYRRPASSTSHWSLRRRALLERLVGWARRRDGRSTRSRSRHQATCGREGATELASCAGRTRWSGRPSAGRPSTSARKPRWSASRRQGAAGSPSARTDPRTSRLWDLVDGARRRSL